MGAGSPVSARAAWSLSARRDEPSRSSTWRGSPWAGNWKVGWNPIWSRLPDLRLVIDHLAKPPIASGVLDPWQAGIRRAAENPNVYCKVSGMVTEADHRRWTPADLRPYIEVVLEAFGPGRLMFGSDWPVCTLAATYEQVTGALDENLDALVGVDEGVREAIYQTTAAAFYGI